MSAVTTCTPLVSISVMSTSKRLDALTELGDGLARGLRLVELFEDGRCGAVEALDERVGVDVVEGLLACQAAHERPDRDHVGQGLVVACGVFQRHLRGC